MPSNPRAWLVDVGRHKAIDRIRRQILFRGKRRELRPNCWHNARADETADRALDDDMLRLIFTCCHPAFGTEAQVALTLRAVCGLTTAQVARAFLVGDDQWRSDWCAQRRRSAPPGSPTKRRSPKPRTRAGRARRHLSGVHRRLCGDLRRRLMRPDLSREAIRLGRLLDALMPGAPSQGIAGPDAAARCATRRRQTADGDIVLLENQDRRLWDRPRSPRACAGGGGAADAGPAHSYAVQAAIAALHARAPNMVRPTGGRSPVSTSAAAAQPFAGHRAQSRRRGVDGGRPGPRARSLAALAARGGLGRYELLPAVRADLLRRLGRHEEAREAYLSATSATQLEPLRRLYARRIAELNGP